MRIAKLTAVGVVLLLGAGCSSGGPPEVTMTSERTFDPESITIDAGESVTWTNAGSDAHTVTAEQDSIPDGGTYFASGDFTSEEEAADPSDLGPGLLGPGDDYEITFSTPGTYRYYCIPHRAEGMVGTVIVK